MSGATSQTWAPLAFALALAACSEPAAVHYLVVEIDARPAVHDVASLRISLTNESRSNSTDVELEDTFPVTFAVDPAGATGALGIAVEARDADGVLVGNGTGSAALEDDSAALMLDSVDFVINTEVAGDQRPSEFSGEHGFQVAATDDGIWTTAYRADCANPCDVFARRFDETGSAVESSLAAGRNAFPASSDLTSSFSTPAVAATADTSLVVWNADEDVGYSIACRAFDTQGAAKSSQVDVALDDFPNIVSVTAIGNNFAIAWDSGTGTEDNIKGAIVTPTCSPVGTPTQISTVAGSPSKSAVAAGRDGLMYVWLLGGAVRGRVMSSTNAPVTVDFQIVAPTATERVEQVRIASLGASGFAVFSRWGLIGMNEGPGRIEMQRVNQMGVKQGQPLIVTERSGSDLASKHSFGVAAAEDGTLLLVWHACGERGDDTGCGVFGQLIDSSGALLGGELVVPTTTTGNQSGPSAVALPDDAWAVVWSDDSATEPDRSGFAARGRVIYPSGSSSERAVRRTPRRDLGVLPL